MQDRLFHEEVLDGKGFISVVDKLGDELTVVNSARVSFGRSKREIDDGDLKLMGFLKDHKHYSPFRHVMVQFHIKMPEFVMRQWYKHCYSADTEVLTSHGWKLWPYVTKDDELANVTEAGKFYFAKPKELICNNHVGTMISFKSRDFDILVTDKHRMIVDQRIKGGPNAEDRWERIESTAQHCLVGEYRLPTLPRFDMKTGDENDFFNGCLYGMFLGDGSVDSNRIVFVVKKDRKKRILTILSDMLPQLNWNISENNTTGYTTFRADKPSEIFKGVCKNKAINIDYKSTTQKYLEGCFQGLVHSDGAITKSGTERFTSSSDDLIKTFEKLALYLGKPTSTWSCEDFSIVTVKKNKPRHLARGDRGRVIKNGKVYCATVDTGALLVRRNGKVSVCGNCVGIETTSSYPTKDHAWNEISGRYIPITDYYEPKEWREQHKNNKQASAGALDRETQAKANAIFRQTMGEIFDGYQALLDIGVAKEQARIVLPLNMYTEIYWTASLQAIMHFIELRDHAGAQGEIQECARVMEKAMREILPTVTNIWLGDKNE